MLHVYVTPAHLRERALHIANRRRDHLIRQEHVAARLAAMEAKQAVETPPAEPPKRKRGRPRKVHDAE